MPILDLEQQHRYAALEEDALWQLEDKYDVDLNRCFGPDRQELQCKLGAILILNWQRSKTGTSLDMVTGDRRVELIPAIMKTPGVFFDEPTRQRCDRLTAQDYADFLDGCPMFELNGGVDFEWATMACTDLVSQLRRRIKSA